MKKKKGNKILSVIWMTTYIVMVLGATFSYFTGRRQSEEGAVTAISATIGVNVNISALYNDKLLIPMNDEDVIKGYNNECVDIYNYGACQTYNIDMDNFGERMGYTGTITFTLDGIKNLNYLILDENDEIYLDKTQIVSETAQSFGPTIELEEGETKNFKLVIWVPNYDYNQNDEDAGGYFNASIGFESTTGSRITGTLSGRY